MRENLWDPIRYFDRYVAIDLETDEAFLSPGAAEATQNARNRGKGGELLHLVRIGYPDRREKNTNE